MTFDGVCSCLVAAYRWSIIGQGRWLPGTRLLQELKATEERPLKDEAAPAAKRWRADGEETNPQPQAGSST
jgi:hypothetical protein